LAHPGRTVRFGEVLTAAVARVARHELGLEATAQALLGYIEYPSHLEAGLDWPVGMAFRTELATSSAGKLLTRPDIAGWFSHLPDEMHDEQRVFLRAHGLAT
jgi:ADP-ribose pyrophosphatase YjhB (NUDIX family)